MCGTVKAIRKGMPKLESKLVPGKVQVEGATCALCVRLYVERYTYAPVVILLYAQQHSLKNTTQKRHYHKVNHSDVRGKGSNKKSTSMGSPFAESECQNIS